MDASGFVKNGYDMAIVDNDDKLDPADSDDLLRLLPLALFFLAPSGAVNFSPVDGAVILALDDDDDEWEVVVAALDVVSESRTTGVERDFALLALEAALAA